MWIKNYTSSDLVFKANGASIKLTANATTLIPDGLTTLANLQTLFGVNSVAQVTSGSAITLNTNQQVAYLGKLYLTQSIPGTQAKIYVGNTGTIDIYGSDSQNIPSAFSTMSCPTENTGVTGLLSFGNIPKYIAFKSNTGTPEIVLTDIKLIEVKTIS